MEKDFWLSRWKENQIGFHQEKPNPHLTEYAEKIKEGGSVFLPLCGKSLDIKYASDQGLKTAGVELSPLACEAFFAENNIPFEKETITDFTVYRSERITLYCGDFFHLKPDHLSGISSVFDRASLIALPPDMRNDYASHMMKLFDRKVRILLVTMEYPQNEMSGPPFSVSEEEVKSLYEGRFSVEKLSETDSLKENPNLKERGLTSMKEKVYLLS